VNLTYLESINPNDVEIEILLWEQVADCELDEMWSFVQNKGNQRWLWLAIDHETRAVLAFVFGQRKDKVFKELKALLEPFGITRFYTDDWGAYERNLAGFEHIISKKNTQRIERKNLTLRTRIKRLCRKTICFSKTIQMHDIVIGLVINILEFGLSAGRAFNKCRA
jgi:insertion element IS1 protein InsB